MPSSDAPAADFNDAPASVVPPATDVPAAAPDSPDVALRIAELARTAFRSDLQQARRHAENRPDLAYYFYRNALAFAGWVPPGAGGENSAEHLMGRMNAVR